MSELNLPACPICHAKESLTPETVERAGQAFTWYECAECGSVLLWMGDEQWAYQKVGREEKTYLLRQPLTLDDLRALKPQAEPRDPSGKPSRDTAAQTRIHSIIPWLLGLVIVMLLAFATIVAYEFATGAPLLTTATPTAFMTPTPVFAAGNEVKLVDRKGPSVTIWKMRDGCHRETIEDYAHNGSGGKLGSGLCYSHAFREWYYWVEVEGGPGGWIQEGYLVLAAEYTSPPPTERPRPARGATAPPEATRGWLCNFDRTGWILLWTAASRYATVKDVVGTCVACCVDVMMHESEVANGITFYRIGVGGKSGWVDLDYYYRNKPGWSNN